MTERRVFVYRRRGGRGEAAPQKSLAPETARGEEEEEEEESPTSDSVNFLHAPRSGRATAHAP